MSSKYGINFKTINEFDKNYQYARKLVSEMDVNVNESLSTYLNSESERGAFFAEFLADQMIELIKMEK